MELKDYSGPYRHDLKFEDFSKEFLVKLMKLWQRAFYSIQGCWYETVAEKYGSEAAESCFLAACLKQPERTHPQFAELGNIQLNTVIDSLKMTQLTPDTYVGSELFAGTMDVKDANHVIATTTKCVLCESLETSDPGRIPFLCGEAEKQIFEKFFCNPKIKVTPLKLPPRKGPDDVFCQWEFKIESTKKHR